MTQPFPNAKIVFTKLTKIAQVSFTTAIAFHLWVTPAFAGDPFGRNAAHQIGDHTEAAFKAIFQQGNYPEAERHLKEALAKEPNEPLAYAMQASLAYTKGDMTGLDKYSQQILDAGQKLVASDPLRGNLYTAVGHFFEGAVIVTREGAAKGATQALGRLRQVYEYLDKAEAISPKDPELNLLRGYMDLMLSVNLPFANPDEAIGRLETSAAPRYLADRGIAIGYRDLKQYTQALDYANQAIQGAPDNPELYYLKAQILREKGKREKSQELLRDAIANFDTALTKKSQLPASLVKQIERERNSAVNQLNK
ncbi:tetratricopeptide repeat protein [Nostoc sp. FACHB-87]|uniref:Sll0314/Alr1548 family TPR repeat-containing protein n=1 Tax=Nostocales TaxID=1161 RepID=UPI001688A48C|nr:MULTISPECIES: Sll0314/Alr1548 family TPR repeat-containing protein [Nostocales]MBD2455708.1 tetratricopeptide repeat protein [Nostoc sp. FACHB-87]MBD2477339.1 tetratricopeptide repeat protein [Anabaena sp. FACHB-83]MBD2490735.1 tetratricopeptide repeat protein [Aulosira sp. FACHB-615]